MINFDEINPVGMISLGGQVAQAMANAAKKMIATPNWEAFHYERMTDNSFELTGGIVHIQNGTKRWLEPHDSIIVSNAQVLEELSKLMPEMEKHDTLASHSNSIEAIASISDSSDMFLHLTLKLPKDVAARNQILKSCHLHAEIFEAPIVACKIEKK